MRRASLNWQTFVGCAAFVGLLAYGAVAMIRFVWGSYGPKEAAVALCGDMAEHGFGSVAVATNSRYIHFNEATRILCDKRSSEHFTDIELARARFDKARVVGRTEYLTIVSLGDIVFLVSNDQKIQSLVRRKKFRQIKEHLIRDISDEIAHQTSERTPRPPLESTGPTPSRPQPTQPNQVVTPIGIRTCAAQKVKPLDSESSTQPDDGDSGAAGE